MTRTPAARRPAFTLIELLVVISIIAVLAAITTGVFGRVRLSQTKSATDATLAKLNSLIERRVKAIHDQVADDVKNNTSLYALVEADVLASGGNKDLAKAVWTHAKMKNELPMSFAEAKAPTPVFGVRTIPVKAVFAALPVGVAGGTPEESAVCLYLAVTANAGGGTAAETDGLQQQIGDAGLGGFKCFKDAWGTPIAFVRTAYNGEVAGKPFFVPTPTNPNPFDPFDPRGKLPGMTGLAGWWTAVRAPVTWAGVPTTYPPAAPANLNHTWTAISAGPDKQWWGPRGTPGAATDIYGLTVPDTDTAKDNQLSYRLRREGARGD